MDLKAPLHNGGNAKTLLVVLGELAQLPPEERCAVLAYQAFHHDFRQFERWHLNQRQQILEAKYDKTVKAIFQDLRKARPEQVDSFWDNQKFEVQAIRLQTNSLLLDHPAPTGQVRQWFHHGTPR